MIEKYMAALRERTEELKMLLQEAGFPEETTQAILIKLEIMERIISAYE